MVEERRFEANQIFQTACVIQRIEVTVRANFQIPWFQDSPKFTDLSVLSVGRSVRRYFE